MDLDGDVTENQSPPTSIAKFGGWNVTSEILYSGVIVYKATLENGSTSGSRLVLFCKPAYRHWNVLLYSKDLREQRSALLTFSINKTVPDQVTVDIRKDGVAVPRIVKSMLIAPDLANSLDMNIQNKRFAFNVDGFKAAATELFSRCHVMP